MTELEYKRNVVEALLFNRILCQEHEDKQSLFIPDLSFSGYGHHGWIEVKYAEEPPMSLGSIKHWTKGQEDWLIRHGAAGDKTCFLLFGCPTGHYLLGSAVLARIRHLNVHEALAHAITKGKLIGGMASGLAELLRRLP